jgi:hypothetical protein
METKASGGRGEVVTYVSALHHGDTSALCVPSCALPASPFFLPLAFSAGFFAAADLGFSVGLGHYGIRGVNDQSGREPTLREETGDAVDAEIAPPDAMLIWLPN